MSTAAGLVLAAGGGTRFGMPKALVTVDGELFVDRAVRTLRAGGCDPVAVVLGARADDVLAAARLDDVMVVCNDDWASGLGSSLRGGLDALASAGAPAVVIALADQPGVTPEVVRRLAVAWMEGARAVVATYDGQARNPVLLDAGIWPDVGRLATGDTGARAWLAEHPDEVTRVACDDVGRADDIDTAADLERLTSAAAPEDRG